MFSWLAVLLVIPGMDPAEFEQDGVRIKVTVQSHVYTWEVENLDVAPITSFRIPQAHVYDTSGPEGWTVQYDPQLLFRIPPHFEEHLSDGSLGQDLWDEFAKNKISLATTASVEDRGNQWRISDQSQAFLVRKVKEEFAIFDEAEFLKEYGHYRAWATAPRHGIRRHKSAKFTAQVTGYGSILALGTATVGLADGRAVTMDGVWRPGPHSRSIIWIVAMLLIGIAFVHTAIVAHSSKKRRAQARVNGFMMSP